MKKYKLGLVLGRFQLFHKGHELIIDTALKNCDKVLIFIGSSDKSGTFKNPFDYEFREKIIEEVYKNNNDIIIAPLPDLGIGDVPGWGKYVIDSAIKAYGMPDLIIYGVEDKCEKWYKDYQNLSYLKIDRSNIDISSTKLKEIIINDDYNEYLKYVNKNIIKYYDYIKDVLLKLKDC